MRIEDALWESFGEAVDQIEGDRAGTIREFVRWYVDRPDVVQQLLAEWRAARGDDT